MQPRLRVGYLWLSARILSENCSMAKSARRKRKSPVQEERLPDEVAELIKRERDLDQAAYASVSHRLNNMVFVLIEGRIVYANRQTERILGYVRSDLCSADFDFRRIVAPGSRTAVAENLSRQIEGEDVGPYVCNFLTSDGSERETVVSTELIPIEGKSAILGVVTDLEPYHRLESDLEHHRCLAEQYFDIAPVIMLVLDADCKVRLINRKGADILGYHVGEIVGKDWCENFIPVDFRSEVKAAFSEIIKEKGEDRGEYENDVLTKDHSRKTIEWRNSVVRDAEGKITGVLSSGLDVSGERSVIRALIESEKVHRDFIDHVPIGIFRSTPAGRIVMANSAFVRMLGYDSFDEVSQLNVNKDLYDPDTPRRNFQHAVEADGKIQGYQSKLRRKDGSTLYCREYARAVRDSEGKTVYYEGTIEDISDRINAERDLDYRIEMEKLIARISTRFVNLAPDEVDAGITNALKSVATFISADRAYVCLFSEDGSAIEWTHFWYPAGEGQDTAENKIISTEYFEWIASQILGKQIVRIPRVESLPEEAENEKAELESEDIQSAIMVPLVCGASVLGFAGFEYIWEPRSWTDDEKGFLKLISEILSSGMERRRVEEELLYRLQLEELVASISARFVSVSVDSVDDEILKSLSTVGEFLGIDRCGIYDVREQERAVLMQEWHSSTFSDMSECPQEIHYAEMPYVWQPLLNGETILVSDISKLPAEAEKERRYMEAAGIRSMLCIPFVWGKTGTGFLAFVTHDEACQWQENTISLLKMVAEIFGSALDYKAASAALEKERRLMRSMMNTIPDFIFFKDLEGRFLRTNKAHAANFGMTPADMIGKTDFDLFPKEYAEEGQKDEQKVMETGQPIISKREEIVLPDGKNVWVSTTKVPLRETSGELVGTFGISRDITHHVMAEQERLKMEARMQQTQKLESLGVLSGGIAHDFNNLLMGILGNTGLALMEMNDESPAWNHVKEVETIALRAADLTNQMLAYSGKSKFVVKPVNLSNLVSEMAHLLEVTISDRIELAYSFDEDIGAVEGDASQIRQVVMNLITNASDAIGGKEGRITVETGEQHCDESYLKSCYVAEKLPPGKYAYVLVSDTGSGMDKKTLSKVFDPFFTTKVSGRGLGLAAALGIVRGHKGALRVYTEPNKGTEFKVLFPVSGKKVEEDDTHRKGISRWKADGTILIVDDDEIVRTVSEQILQKFGFSVITATDCESGVRELANNHRLRAVLLDVTLPGKKAGGALVEMRKVDKNVPIILMSGYNEQRATEGLDSDEYSGFIQKPFNAESLAGKLREVIER